MTVSWRRSAISLLILFVIAVAVGAVVTHRSPSKKVLVGLGDSYASGEGNAPFTAASDTPTDRCHDSTGGAYPVIAAQDLGIKGVNNACSGATTDSMVNGTSKTPSQLNGIRNAKYVTVTVGGNDIDALGAIFNPPTPEQYGAKLVDLQPKLVDAYKRIHTAAPHAKIIVVGYPDIIPESEQPGCFLNANEIAPLRTAVGALNNTIEQASKTADVEFVDATEAFAGHELCTQQPWVNGVDLGNFSASLHPNVNGQIALAKLVEAKLK